MSVKEEAQRLTNKLAEDFTWDDLMCEIYVRLAIESGLADSKSGKLKSIAQVRSKFGLLQ